MKKLLLGVFGFFLILVGIAGILLPVIPGWFFIFLGLSFIAPAFAARLKRRVLRRFSKQGVVYLEEWKKLKTHAGFTTRHLPLSLQNTEDFSHSSNQELFKTLFSVNRILLSHGMKPASQFAYLNQVHGDQIVILEDKQTFSQGEFAYFPKADGVLTNLKEATLLVLTADCLPVFFSAGKNEDHWIGLVHAGWRGTQKEIVRKAFQMIRERSKSGASDVHVIFGPRIGKDRYEVGEEFVKYFGSTGSLHRKNNKLYFDLAGENRRQLLQAGARAAHILDLEICTISENVDFYSFRKEKESAGRIVSFISKF